MRANEMTPKKFLELAKEFADSNALKYIQFYDEELLSEKLNLIYSVGKGSVNKPGMFCIEYKPLETEEFSAIIGKGVTFDTGGVNLKPTGFMEDMFSDKAGACAAFASF